MPTMLTNWKTTLAGVATLLGLLGHVLTTLTSGDTSSLVNGLWGEVAALTSGVGLLFAKDHNVTNAPVPVAPKPVVTKK
jgi:hypothetical protein